MVTLVVVGGGVVVALVVVGGVVTVVRAVVVGRGLSVSPPHPVAASTAKPNATTATSRGFPMFPCDIESMEDATRFWPEGGSPRQESSRAEHSDRQNVWTRGVWGTISARSYGWAMFGDRNDYRRVGPQAGPDRCAVSTGWKKPVSSGMCQVGSTKPASVTNSESCALVSAQ